MSDTEVLRKLVQERHHVRCTYIRQETVNEDDWSGTVAVFSCTDNPSMLVASRRSTVDFPRTPRFTEDRGKGYLTGRVAEPLNSRVASLDPRSRRSLEEAGFKWDASTGVWVNNRLGRAISFEAVRDHDPEWLKNWLATGTG